jgi:hypothetical protein
LALIELDRSSPSDDNPGTNGNNYNHSGGVFAAKTPLEIADKAG